MSVKGAIHSYETFAAADGPGVRFLAFLSGCPFRCAYCHNPDTWAKGPAFEADAGEVLAEALKYREYWGDEGGITLSGGEPMMQAQFAAELFEAAHAENVGTCIDTAAGCFDRNDAAVRRLLAASDTVILDIKHMDDAAHRALTGAGVASVLDCARYVAETGGRLWIRRVLVPGLTDDEEELGRLGEFIRSLGAVEKFEILPYHEFGAAKWKLLGIPYSLEGVKPPAGEAVRRAYEAVQWRTAGEFERKMK